MMTERKFLEKYPELNRLAYRHSLISIWSKGEIVDVTIYALDREVPEQIVSKLVPLIIDMAVACNRSMMFFAEKIVKEIIFSMNTENLTKGDLMTPNDVRIKCICEMKEVCIIRAEIRAALFKWVEKHGKNISRLTVDWKCSMQRKPEVKKEVGQAGPDK